MYRAVVFDLDDTVYNYSFLDPLAKIKMGEYAQNNLGIPCDEFLELYADTVKKVDEDILIDNPARHDRLVRFVDILYRKGLPLDPHLLNLYNTYWGTILDNIRPEPGLIPFLEALRHRGLKIAIGSNMTFYMQVRKLESLHILQFIDRIITSEETVVQKPNPYFFYQVSRKLDIPSEDIIFIGDSFKHDYLPATGAGMTGIWYNPRERSVPGGYDCTYMISSFDDCIKGGELWLFGLI